jgi:diguanylate cyclase (GGDEF)-like protein/PAS domain S-box-containing protein
MVKNMYRIKLATFMVENIESILVEWEKFASTIFSDSEQENKKKLRDHAKQIILVIADDLNQFQSKIEQTAKAQGLQKPNENKETPAEKHGAVRMIEGFSMNEMVSEYRALRASVTKLFIEATQDKLQTHQLNDLIRFNEGIDQALTESIASYSSATEKQNRLFETMLSSSPDLSYILDLDGSFLYINDAMCRLYPAENHEILGTTNYCIAMPSRIEVEAHIRHIVDTREKYRGEITFQQSSKRSCIFEYVYAPIFDKKGAVEAIVCASRDVSEKKSAEELIWQSANYDPLTKLVNRRLFREKLNQTIKHSRRSGNAFSLLFIDLDKFKAVNDTLGHDVGDQLLKKAAKRIKACLRDTDTISRLGGDEFTVILEDAHDLHQSMLVTKKVLSAFFVRDKNHIPAPLNALMFKKPIR